jgi:hypothetical protein
MSVHGLCGCQVRSLTEQLHGVASRQGGEQDSMRAELLQKSTNLKILQTQVDVRAPLSCSWSQNKARGTC